MTAKLPPVSRNSPRPSLPPRSDDGQPLIAFKHVQKAFGDKRVYTDLSLEVRRGETLTVIGRSGQGKSVLLKMLIGLLLPDDGEVCFDGERVDQARGDALTQIRRRVGMLFQGAALFDSLNVADNIAYGLREQKTVPEQDVAGRVAWGLEQVGLDAVEAQMPSSLSGGMRKRVGLARVVVMAPEVILYDEPTTGLDPVTTRRINELIKKMARELSVTSIVVTHDMGTATDVSDRIAMVDEGRIVFLGTPAELMQSELPQVRAFLHG